MENTLANREQFNTSLEPQVRSAPMANTYQPNQGSIVFFQCDLEEMFGINLDYPGIRSALNDAFANSKHYIPVETGLMKSSYTMRPKSDTLVECFFDPDKIIGQMRKGHKVEEYYPQFVGSSGGGNRAWNWLTIVMNHFYDTLIADVKSLSKKKEAKQRQEDGRTAINILPAAVAVQSSLEDSASNIADERRRMKKEKAENDKAERQRQRELREQVSAHRRTK